MTSPVMLPQIVQKRHPPLECYDVFAHGAFFASGAQRRRSGRAVQGKDGGRKSFSKDGEAREPRASELSTTVDPPGQQAHGRGSASERGGQQSG